LPELPAAPVPMLPEQHDLRLQLPRPRLQLTGYSARLV
jgi:hypothetical protein